MSRPKRQRAKLNTAKNAALTAAAEPEKNSILSEEVTPETAENTAPAKEETTADISAENPVSAEETKTEDIADSAQEIKEQNAKEAKPAARKKAASKKDEEKKNDIFVLQSSGRDYTMADIVELCKAAYKNGTRKHVRSCDVYVKSENGGLRAYYVINGKPDGSFINL